MKALVLDKKPIPLSEQDDNVLLLFARDDPAGPAFRLLYDRYRGPVFGFLVRLLGEHALAEDVLQETFFKVYEHARSFKSSQPFEPWLYRIARNTGLNAVRARRKVRAASQGLDRVGDLGSSVVSEASLREQVARVGEALDLLPEEMRALLIQRHYLDMKPGVLAESWECTERTIRNRLNAAADQLAAAMQVRARSGDQA